jgi:2-oxoglutarate ferredoxin oxidoreductase subunit alpha
LTRTEANLRIGGAAGEGVQSTGEAFGRICARHGLQVFAYNAFQSVIRGGHTYFHIRASEKKPLCEGDRIDVLIALDQQTADVHARLMNPGGGIIHDPTKVTIDEKHLQSGGRAFAIPMIEYALRFEKLPIMQNTVAAGATLQLFGLDISVMDEMIKRNFGRKSEELAKKNVEAAHLGYDYAAKNFPRLEVSLRFGDRKRAFLMGNQAIGLGAVAAGCKFLAQYPMTPASGILHWLASRAKQFHVVVKQAEDELAAMNMAVGAGYAGVRAMTGTSGGGYALMVEATGMAGMTETPVVVVECQRTGPSTGLPTKTEQGDLNMMLGAGQGDFPRAILAPRSTTEAFYMMGEAFNLAERWQTPVFVASDFMLSEHFETVEDFDLEFKIDRGLLVGEDGTVSGGAGPAVAADGGRYNRYALTESGVSPRSIPGTRGHAHTAGTDEHDEHGDLISDVLAGTPDAVRVRVQQMDKRMRKLEGIRAEMKAPEFWSPDGMPPEQAQVTVVSWGSTQGAAREACELLGGEGVRANSLEFSHVFPLPVNAVLDRLRRARRTVMVEANYTGQFQRLLRAETGWQPDSHFRKFDGETFTPQEIANAVRGKI